MQSKKLQQPEQLIKAVVRLYSEKAKEATKQWILKAMDAPTLEEAKGKIINQLMTILSNWWKDLDTGETFEESSSLFTNTRVLLWEAPNRGVFEEGKDFVNDWYNQLFMNGDLKRISSANALSGSFQYAITTFLWCMAYRQPDGSMKVFRINDQIQRLRNGIQALWLWKLEYSDEDIKEALEWTAEHAAKKKGENNSSDAVYIRPFAWADAKNFGISWNAMQWYVDLVVEAEYFNYLKGEQKLYIPNNIIRDVELPEDKLSAQYDTIRILTDQIKSDPTLQDFTGWLMLDKEGNIAEMANNIFFIQKEEEEWKKVIVTPPLWEILPWFTRDTAITLLWMRGHTVKERHIKPNELHNFEACFTTGTASACKEVALITYNSPEGKKETSHFDINNDILKTIQADYFNLVSGNFDQF